MEQSLMGAGTVPGTLQLHKVGIIIPVYRSGNRLENVKGLRFSLFIHSFIQSFSKGDPSRALTLSITSTES